MTIKTLIQRAFQGSKPEPIQEQLTDDFDWNTYSTIYRNDVQQFSTTHCLRLNTGDYEFSGGILCKARNEIKPLHCNHRLLYETILQLRASSIAELGCGAGDHCRNLKVLKPDLRINGYDISTEQLIYLKERNPELDPTEFREMDITLPTPESLPKYDLAFTQAVIMHIHSGKGHLVALANLFRLAKRQVILMENWSRHDFMDDICRLNTSQIINWPSVYFYYRRAPERNNRPHLMVISSRVIPGYEVLTDYAVLRDNTGGG